MNAFLKLKANSIKAELTYKGVDFYKINKTTIS